MFLTAAKCFRMWWPGTESNRRRQPFQGWIVQGYHINNKGQKPPQCPENSPFIGTRMGQDLGRSKLPLPLLSYSVLRVQASRRCSTRRERPVGQAGGRHRRYFPTLAKRYDVERGTDDDYTGTPPEAEAKLVAQAKARGLSLDAFLQTIITTQAAAMESVKSVQALP